MRLMFVLGLAFAVAAAASASDAAGARRHGSGGGRAAHGGSGLAMASPAMALPGGGGGGAGGQHARAAAIRAVRGESNRAIAAHDLAAFTPAFKDDAVFVWSNGTTAVGKPALEAFFARDFADPAFVAYVRTPARVAVSWAGVRAVE